MLHSSQAINEEIMHLRNHSITLSIPIHSFFNITPVPTVDILPIKSKLDTMRDIFLRLPSLHLTPRSRPHPLFNLRLDAHSLSPQYSLIDAIRDVHAQTR